MAGTTVPPPIPSIARRGEWSIGMVLDVYWHFGSVGDHYLGRILAGLDPNSKSFDALPPHWTCTNPMSDDGIKRGMEMTFGGMLEEHPGFVPVLLRTFACIVYHSQGLIEQMVRCPGHDFAKLALLHDRDLLDELMLLVTIDPTEGVMMERTGIPPHVNHARQLGLLMEQMGMLMDTVSSQNETLVTSVTTALENRAWESGHVTGDRLKTILSEYKDDTIKAVNTKLEELQRNLKSRGNLVPSR